MQALLFEIDEESSQLLTFCEFSIMRLFCMQLKVGKRKFRLKSVVNG